MSVLQFGHFKMMSGSSPGLKNICGYLLKKNHQKKHPTQGMQRVRVHTQRTYYICVHRHIHQISTNVKYKYVFSLPEHISNTCI